MKRALLMVSLLSGLVLIVVAARWPRTVQAATATVTWEAEDEKGDIAAPFQRRTGTRLDKRPRPQRNSGGGWVEIRDKANGDKKEGDGSDLPGHLIFKVNIPEEGQYTLWARVLWPDGCGNSFFVRQQGRNRRVLGEDGTYDSWHWIDLKGPKLTLSRGVNVIEVLNREDGVLLDQLQLTATSRVPVGEQRPTANALAD